MSVQLRRRSDRAGAGVGKRKAVPVVVEAESVALVPVSAPPSRSVGRPPRGGRSPSEIHIIDPPRRPTGIDKYLADNIRREMSARKFHPDDFHVAISDENGHDTKLAGIRWHPMMANEMNMIYERRTFPFGSVHDLIRWAVFEGMKKLYELEKAGGISSYLPRIAAINRISLQSEHNRVFDESKQQVDTHVEKLLAMGKHGIAAMYVHDVLAEAKQIPEKSWRDDYVSHIMRRYRGLLKEQGRSVKLSRRAADDEQ